MLAVLPARALALLAALVLVLLPTARAQCTTGNDITSYAQLTTLVNLKCSSINGALTLNLPTFPGATAQT